MNLDNEQTTDAVNEVASKRKKTSNGWRKQLLADKGSIEQILMDGESLATANEAGFTKGELNQQVTKAAELVQEDIEWVQLQGEKKKTLDSYKQSLEILDKNYIAHVVKARIIFDEVEDRNIYQSLLLDGKRPNDFGTLMDYIRRFYSIAQQDKEIAGRFKQRNINPELVQQMLLLVDEVEDKHVTSLHKAKVAKRATERRDAQKDKFYAWFRTFKGLYNATPRVKEKAPASSKAKTTEAKV